MAGPGIIEIRAFDSLSEERAVYDRHILRAQERPAKRDSPSHQVLILLSGDADAKSIGLLALLLQKQLPLEVSGEL